jgi:hypothetical protein
MGNTGPPDELAVRDQVAYNRTFLAHDAVKYRPSPPMPRYRLSICYISLSLPRVDCDERQWLRAQPAAR